MSAEIIKSSPFPFRDFLGYEPAPRLIAETDRTRLFFVNRESRGDTFLLHPSDPSKRDLLITQKFLYIPEAPPLPSNVDLEVLQRFITNRSIFDEKKANLDAQHKLAQQTIEYHWTAYTMITSGSTRILTPPFCSLEIFVKGDIYAEQSIDIGGVGVDKTLQFVEIFSEKQKDHNQGRKLDQLDGYCGEFERLWGTRLPMIRSLALYRESETGLLIVSIRYPNKHK
ncbi:MAG: hypothetical protein AABX29_01750 [Nanoarchaeota archaeon]